MKYKEQGNRVNNLIRNWKKAYQEERITNFPVYLAEREPRKAFMLLKDIMKENSSWKTQTARTLVKPKDLVAHYQELFKDRTTEEINKL